MKDFGDRGVAVTAQELRRMMQQFHEYAMEEISRDTRVR
jgi:hypothetical protein